MSRSPEAIRKIVLWTAWPLVALGLLAILLALPMWLFYGFILTPDIIVEMRRDPAFVTFPDEIWSLVAGMPLLLELTLVAALATLAVCFGALARQRWGYYGLLAMFWSGVPLNLAGMVWHWQFVDRIHPSMAGMLEQLQLPAFFVDYWAMQVSGLMFGLVFAIGFGLTARQWQAPDIRAWFGANRPPETPP